MFFGNETYLTQGAFFHVVGIMQMNIKFIEKIITKDELLDSIIENYSYLYAEYQLTKNIFNFLTLASKYLIRILDGIERINKNKKYKKLKDLLLEAKKIRREKTYDNKNKLLIKKIYKLLKIEIKEDNLIVIFKEITKFIKDELPEFPLEIIQ